MGIQQYCLLFKHEKVYIIDIHQWISSLILSRCFTGDRLEVIMTVAWSVVREGIFGSRCLHILKRFEKKRYIRSQYDVCMCIANIL